jgi:hypothetical protein
MALGQHHSSGGDMTIPALTKTWTISANNRVVFTTLNGAMSGHMFGIKQFLKANGYTVKGSSTGSVAPPANTLITDGVDRWATAADAATRGAGANNAQSWIILTDGNGADILIAYQGATDDIIVIQYSVGQLWTTQATATFQPTATDSLAVSTNGSLIGNSGITTDRMWCGWVDSQKKLCRFMVASGGLYVGSVWGIELFSTEVSLPGLVSPAIWGFFFPATGAIILNGSVAGHARELAGSIVASIAQAQIYFGTEWIGLSSNGWGLIKTELQGGLGYPILPLGIASQASGFNGKLGMLFDTYRGQATAGAGVIYGNRQWISIGGYNGSGTVNEGMWPWDGVTDPLLT